MDWKSNAHTVASVIYPSYQTSGSSFISVAMYTVHASIVLLRSRFNSVGLSQWKRDGLSEMETLKFLHRTDVKKYRVPKIERPDAHRTLC